MIADQAGWTSLSLEEVTWEDQDGVRQTFLMGSEDRANDIMKRYGVRTIRIVSKGIVNIPK